MPSQPVPHAVFVKHLGDKHKDTRGTKALADLYAAWHAADPSGGHDAKAAQWKAALEASNPVP